MFKRVFTLRSHKNLHRKDIRQNFKVFFEDIIRFIVNSLLVIHLNTEKFQCLSV